MTFKELKHKIKEEQKYLAQQIRLGKPLRKPRIFESSTDEAKSACRNLYWNVDEFRHKHIIYCNMFNNTPYEKIEQPRLENRPSTHRLDKIRKEWEAELDEALRDCA